MEWTKADLINALATIHHYNSYLEICTPTSGHLYGRIDRTRYPTCHRLMYRCVAGIPDELTIDFRIDDLDIAAAVKAIRARPLRYDVVLVDSFHEYETSLRDLRAACALLAPGGTIVVHDCFPREEALANPRYQDGFWCGVSYKAYLDVVLADPKFVYCTVDTDYGCGIVRRASRGALLRGWARYGRRFFAPDARDDLMRKWKTAGADPTASFRLLQAFSAQLLKLVTVDEFLAAERDGAPISR